MSQGGEKMYDEGIVLFEYTEILMGMRRNFSTDFFDCGNAQEDEEHAVSFVRTVARVFLKCRNSRAAEATIKPSLIKKMRLAPVMEHIQIPRYVRQDKRSEYRMARIFQPGFCAEEWIAHKLCEGILSGEVSKFPKEYMSEFEGYERAKYCLNYHITKFLPMYQVHELYRFSATPEFSRFLKRRLLQNVRMKMFDSPVEYLHESLPKNCRMDSYYHVYDTIYRVNCRYMMRHPVEYDGEEMPSNIRDGS